MEMMQNDIHRVMNVKMHCKNSFVVMKVSFLYDWWICIGKYFLVNSTFAKKLEQLDGHEIVFICDDSGSMNLPLSE